MQAEGKNFDYAWMKSLVSRLKEEIGWRTLQTSDIYKINQLSIGLTCEYTKSKLRIPVRTNECKHVYCMEKEVLEEVGQCVCGEILSAQNPIQPAKTIQQILQYVNTNRFPQQRIMVVFSHHCLFPLQKDNILYEPEAILSEILKEYSKEGKIKWDCEHLSGEFTILETHENLKKCKCGVTALVKPKTRVKIKLQ